MARQHICEQLRKKAASEDEDTKQHRSQSVDCTRAHAQCMGKRKVRLMLTRKRTRSHQRSRDSKD